MNIKYETGNIIRDSSDFDRFKFPAELPTEEWKGNEARSYTNYIRPVANLFENDRENLGFAKDLYKSWLYVRNSLIEGCTVVKTTINNENYYEIQHGAFINDGKVFYIFPACEALAKQISNEYQNAGNPEDIRLKITYDYETNNYTYLYIDSGFEPHTDSAETAVGLINKLITALEISPAIEGHIVLPIFKNTDSTTIYFNGTSVVSGEPTGDNNTVIATIANGVITQSSVVSTIEGSRIEDGTISNSKISNNNITLGTTVINLGETKKKIEGFDSINNVWPDGNGTITLSYKTGNSVTTKLTVPNGVDYTLGNAATKTFDTDRGLTTNGNLPTNSAVKGYIEDLLDDAEFTGKATFDDGIEVVNSLINTSGKINVTNTADASGTSSSLSGNASIVTKGGIEADGNIYSKNNIVGLNAGTYSKRELKENIKEFTDSATDLINTVDIVSYNYKSDADKNYKIGFIADDTHEYFATKEHNIMDQSNCIGILLKAVQELSAEVKFLKESLNELKSNNTESGE